MNIRAICGALAIALYIAGTSGGADAQSNSQRAPDLSKNAGKIQKKPIPISVRPITRLLIKHQKGKQSGPVCGGVVNGKVQKPCGTKPAKFTSAALGKCPKGSFFDIGLWQCWSCPQGYKRTLTAVDTDQACSRPNKKIKGQFKKATFMGHVCPKGTFHDGIRDGECRKCPRGYKRSVFHVDTNIACHRPAKESLIAITRNGRAGVASVYKCPIAGQFPDGIDNYCYSCKSGYRRTGYSVRDPRACSKVITEKWDKTSVVKKAACESGEFKDELYQKDARGKTVGKRLTQLRGGSCWTCPDKYTRTFYAVKTSKACEKGGGIEYKAASKKADLTCPAGQIFDFIGLTAADIRSRPELKGKRISAVKSGTCWSCPTGYDRSGGSGVKSSWACQAKIMEWYSRPFDEPGLFGLKGADTVLFDLTKFHPEFIAASIREVAKSRAKLIPGMSEAKALKQEKRNFAKTPERSPAAAAAVFARIFAGISEPSKASAAEKELIKSFTAHIIKKRLHVTRDALAAYDAWKKAADHWETKMPPGVISVGMIPPDFEEIALANAVGLTAAGEILARATEKLPYVGDALGILLGAAGNGFADFSQPSLVGNFALRTGAEMGAGVGAHYLFKKALTKLSIEAAKKASSVMAQRLAGIATQRTLTLMAQQGVSRAASTAATAATGAGPQIVVAAGIMLVGMLIDHLNAVADARPKILAAIAHAKRSPDLRRRSKTEDGNIEMLTYWNYLTAGHRSPGRAFRTGFARISGKAVNWRCGALNNRACTPKEAKTACDAGLKKESKTNKCAKAKSGITPLPLKTARSCPAITSGLPMQASSNKRSGSSVKQKQKRKPKLSVAERRALKDRQNRSLKSKPSKWAHLPGVALDIGIGARGNLWTLGRDGEAQYFSSGKKWVPTKAKGIRIDAGKKGTACMVGDSGSPRCYAKSRWKTLPGRATDIGVGINSHVWVIGADKLGCDHSIQKWQGGKWKKISGGAVRIDVDPAGNAWVVNSANQIFRYSDDEWTQVKGQARDIGIGANGTVWIVGMDYAPYEYRHRSWVRTPGKSKLRTISVQHQGYPAGTDGDGRIYRR